MSSISNIAIKNPVFSWMFMFSIILFGGISFLRMGVSRLPDVDFPYVNVNVEWIGASPQSIDSEIITPLEGALAGVQGVKNISATARNGSAQISLEFDISKNLDIALQETQSKVNQAMRRLPKEAEVPIVSKSNPNDQPIMWLALQKPPAQSSQEIYRLIQVANEIKNQFSSIEGVSEAFLTGITEPEIIIELDAQKLKQYELTLSDIQRSIESDLQEVSHGRWTLNKSDYTVRTPVHGRSAETISKLMITSRGGGTNFRPIPLAKVATVKSDVAEIRRISRFNGKEAVGLAITKQPSANAVELAKEVRIKLTQLKNSIPPEYQLDINVDQTKHIEESIHELLFTILISALLTGLLCWYFLGSLSSTINILFAIPTSVVGTFIVLAASGFTLNLFTLLGLSLAIGIVVDDSIMVLENIFKHRDKNQTPLEAAKNGAEEITFAAVAATLSIAAIFIPVAFMDGLLGKYFFEFGVTITVAVLFSLAEALTLTPMRLSIMKGNEKIPASEKFFKLALKLYKKSLNNCLVWPKTTLSIALLLSLAPLYFLTKMKTELIPSEDQSRLMLSLQTPSGSSLDYTNSQTLIVEKKLSEFPEVSHYFSNVGGMGSATSNRANIFINLFPKTKRKLSQKQLMDKIRTEVNQTIKQNSTSLKNSEQQTKIFVHDLSLRSLGGSSRGFPLEFSLSAYDWNALTKSANSLHEKLSQEKFITDLNMHYQQGAEEVVIQQNTDKILQHYVSKSAISDTLTAYVSGLIIGEFEQDGLRNNIRLKIADRSSKQLENQSNLLNNLQNIYVRNQRSELIAIQNLIRANKQNGEQSINRENRKYLIHFSATPVAPLSATKAYEEVEKIFSKYKIDQNQIILSKAGSSEDTAKSFKSLIQAIILGLVIAYMILASQMNSWILPIGVLLALPLAMSGAWLGLATTGQTLNLYSMIGIILLMGIVKKNSIILVDFIQKDYFTRFGENSKIVLSQYIQSIKEAAPQRLRPILMTSIATIVGAIPAAISFGPGSESRIPMAVVLIGGVLSSTILTLYVVPIFLLFLNKVKSSL